MTGSPRRLLALTAVLAAVFALVDWAEGGPGLDHPLRDIPLWALNTLPLLLLGRNPLAVGLLFSVAYPVWIIVGHPGHLLQSLPTIAAMYAVGAWARPIWLRATALILPAWMLAATDRPRMRGSLSARGAPCAMHHCGRPRSRVTRLRILRAARGATRTN